MSGAGRVLGAVLGAVLAAGLLVALGALSRAPIPGEHAGSAALRLTWRVRGEEVGGCRHPSPEELAELPTHMQNPDACVGGLPPFHLTVEVDGRVLVEERVDPAGARGDRPLYVYRELLLEPGTHRIRVRFSPEDGADALGDGGLGALELDGTVTLDAGEVLLLTRGEEGGLEVRAPVA